MVGTIEPRKGHALVIDAFERLWSQGADVNLCIVGKQGWIVESLIDRMRTLAARQPRFSWLPEVSDGTLQALYQEATCLIAASLDEGFGLPIVEAAKHGLPIIARDIPVFREVGRDGTAYFSATTGEALASFITAWLKKFKRGETPNPAQVRQVTWRQSAIALLGRVNGSSEVDDSASVTQIRTAELLSA
jgi:glycosyltransferase involved in cell wall biosynthesis